jgi:hypothetical protein
VLADVGRAVLPASPLPSGLIWLLTKRFIFPLRFTPSYRRCRDARRGRGFKSGWIHVTPVTNAEQLAQTRSKTGLGAGEVSAVFLANEIRADLTLIDEWKGRRLAREEGLAVVGCVGILEELIAGGRLRTCARIIWNFCGKISA